MTSPTELHISIPFGTLAGLAWGSTDARPLLALHGWLDNAASFASLALELADKHRFIALDLPGHGHSAHAPAADRRYHIVDQVDHVLDFVDALGLERFDLLGHSLGAGIASLVAAAAPERVGRLVLIDGLGPLADDGTDTLAHWQKAQARRSRQSRKPRVFAHLDEAVKARVEVSDMTADQARPIVARNLRQTDDGLIWRSDARLRLPTPVRMAEGQVRDLLAGIKAETLLLLAHPATPYLPSAMMNARAARLANIRVEHMDGPHHLHVACAGQVAATVRKFMERLT